MNKWRDATILLCFLVTAGSAGASEFRSLRPILTPSMAASGGAGAAMPGRVIRPVSRAVAGKVAEKIIAAWNGNNIDSVLADQFFDKSRLSDAMNTKVPRDARLEVLAIQDVQTLGQKVTTGPGGRQLVSTVSITLKTQVTFNDPANGYQRLQGVNEYIVRIHQPLRGQPRSGGP